jgi:hypothetical protein
MKEKDILYQALQQFTAITRMVLKIVPANKEKPETDYTKLELQVLEPMGGYTLPRETAYTKLELQAGTQKTYFDLLLKNEIRQLHVPEIIAKIGNSKTDWLLICQYIPKPVKEILKTAGINYLEAAGNCFIQKEGFFFYINDQPVTPLRQVATGKLWKTAGIRLVFALLQNPDLIDRPYREIAQKAHIALGNIGDLLQELQQQGYVQTRKETNKEILYLERKQELEKKWIELFITMLRPKLLQGRFRFMTAADKTRWKTLQLPNAYWGGETAGALLTNYLEPETFTIYTNQPKIDIMKTWRLLPDKKGELEILDLFWDINPETEEAKKNTVPALLAYAELITSLDSRNRETAERIKQQYLETN